MEGVFVFSVETVWTLELPILRHCQIFVWLQVRLLHDRLMIISRSNVRWYCEVLSLGDHAITLMHHFLILPFGLFVCFIRRSLAHSNDVIGTWLSHLTLVMVVCTQSSLCCFRILLWKLSAVLPRFHNILMRVRNWFWQQVSIFLHFHSSFTFHWWC